MVTDGPWTFLYRGNFSNRVCGVQCSADLTADCCRRLLMGTFADMAEDNGVPFRVYLVGDSGQEQLTMEYFLKTVTWHRLLKDIGRQGYPVCTVRLCI